MKKTLLAALLLGGTALFGQIGIGITIGAPPPPRVIVRPAAPGPDFVWVDGYWYPVSGHYKWHTGYWTRAPYAGAVWVGPRYEGHQYYNGYWEGSRGRMEHDHRWDKGHDRDYGHDHDRDHDRH
jgi:hypothetical protein